MILNCQVDLSNCQCCFNLISMSNSGRGASCSGGAASSRGYNSAGNYNNSALRVVPIIIIGILMVAITTRTRTEASTTTRLPATAFTSRQAVARVSFAVRRPVALESRVRLAAVAISAQNKKMQLFQEKTRFLKN